LLKGSAEGQQAVESFLEEGDLLPSPGRRQRWRGRRVLGEVQGRLAEDHKSL